MLQFKIFVNGATTLPTSVRWVLEAGDCVSYVISEDGVHIVKAKSQSETADVLACNGQS